MGRIGESPGSMPGLSTELHAFSVSDKFSGQNASPRDVASWHDTRQRVTSTRVGVRVSVPGGVEQRLAQLFSFDPTTGPYTSG